MNRKNLLGSLGLALLLTGCMVRGSGGAYVSGPSVAVVEVESEPPPPRVVHYEARAGHIWIDGRWNWRGGQWVWADGFYERERAGYVYAPGRWENRGGRRHVWVEGRWNAGRAERREERQEIRDNRRDQREERREDRGGGPVIRDHRR